jgi:hypothetical protein
MISFPVARCGVAVLSDRNRSCVALSGDWSSDLGIWNARSKSETLALNIIERFAVLARPRLTVQTCRLARQREAVSSHQRAVAGGVVSACGTSETTGGRARNEVGMIRPRRRGRNGPIIMHRPRTNDARVRTRSPLRSDTSRRARVFVICQT